MLRGDKVTLRAVRLGDLPRLLHFYNDVDVELAGGGDPPRPTTLERLQRDFDKEAAEPPRARRRTSRTRPTATSSVNAASSTVTRQPATANWASPSATKTTGGADTGARRSRCSSTTPPG